MSVRIAPRHAAPPSKETILRRLEEVKRGAVKLNSHEDLLTCWAKQRAAAVKRIQGKPRSIQ